MEEEEDGGDDCSPAPATAACAEVFHCCISSQCSDFNAYKYGRKRVTCNTVGVRCDGAVVCGMMDSIQGSIPCASFHIHLAFFPPRTLHLSRYILEPVSLRESKHARADITLWCDLRLWGRHV